MPVPSYNVSVGDVAEVSIRGKIDGQRTITVLHYRVDTLPGASYDGPTLLDQLVQDLEDASSLFSNYKALCCAVWSLETVRAQWISAIRYAYKNYPSYAGPGGNLNDCMPANVSVAIERKSIFAGRGGYGTTHFPAVAVNKITGSEVNAADQIGYRNWGLTTCSNSNPATGVQLIPVLFKRSAPATGNVPSTAVVQPTIRIMRRRTVGVGE
jgi:hypothetical protein